MQVLAREDSVGTHRRGDRWVGMARPGPSWSCLDQQQERDVRALVRLVTLLQDEADPNFQLALNFAWSSFR